MTPFEFDILLHYYVSSAPHRVQNEVVPIWPETLEWFVREGLLEIRDKPTDYGSIYRTTPRAAAFIEAALATPLPIQKWVMP